MYFKRFSLRVWQIHKKEPQNFQIFLGSIKIYISSIFNGYQLITSIKKWLKKCKWQSLSRRMSRKRIAVGFIQLELSSTHSFHFQPLPQHHQILSVSAHCFKVLHSLHLVVLRQIIHEKIIKIESYISWQLCASLQVFGNPINIALKQPQDFNLRNLNGWSCLSEVLAVLLQGFFEILTFIFEFRWGILSLIESGKLSLFQEIKFDHFAAVLVNFMVIS